MMAKSILIAAGGTGGHMFPAAAFSTELRNRGWSTTLMTDARGKVYADGFPADAIEIVDAANFVSKNPLALASAGVKIARGVIAAQGWIGRHRPALVAGFGGFPSLPAVWAAQLTKTPYLLHEQNAVLGRVNRRFAAGAAAVACGFDRLDKLDAAAAHLKVVTGNPVRAPIRAVRDRAFPLLPAGAPIEILCIGGSQGARVLGDTIPAAIAMLPDDLRSRVRIVHQVRDAQAAAAGAMYARAGVPAEVAPFFKDMAERYAKAHLVIARAGASSVTEIAVVGRPAIFVPLAIAADDHQTANAEGLTSIGAADAIIEAEFTPDSLVRLLALRLDDPHGLGVRAAAAKAAGKPDAAETLADLAEKVARATAP
jgi:UDP-N-acetylglucosamine--N-acetylmuramyl-(pentapeptide) pyrophosphoryl-undecaprenol N-acetylglucosamine transferase